MTRPIVFDVDGVLADFHNGYIRLAASLGKEVSHLLPGVLDWDFFLDSQVWVEIERSPRFWYDLQPLPARETLDQVAILTRKRDVYFATSRIGINPLWQTTEWLRRWLSIVVPHVVITSRKGEFCKAMDAEYFIDDKAGNAVYTQYESPETRVYLVDKPYNQFPSKSLGSNVKRVKSVEEFLGNIS